MDIHLSIFKKAIVFTGLALVYIGPLLAARKIPERFPGSRAAHDANQVALSTPALVQNSQASEPQDSYSQQPRRVTTERLIANPPQVTYEDGQLTIVTENSSLSEVMSALHKAMGVDIDLPASVASQRIWIRLGPGPARRVLRDLLDTTELNYVFQASETDEEGIRSVLLTLRSKNEEPGGPGTRVAKGTIRRNQPASSSSEEVPEQESPVPSESAAASEATPTAPPPSPTSARSAASNQPSVEGSSEPIWNRPGVGTSEQKMQQLQSMYEQRRQIQMQQNRKPPGTN